MERIKDRNLEGLIVILISLVIFSCLTILMKLLYSLSFKDSLLWYVGVFVYFYIPGSLLLRWLSFNRDEYFIRLFHSIALGTALIPLFYTILRRISLGELLYPFGIGIFLLWLVLTVRDFKRGNVTFNTSYQDILPVFILVVFVFLLLHLSHFTDIAFFDNGYKLRTGYTETVFHLGIINVLRDAFPPSFPYASGHSFAYYHLNMHLEIEMFNRIFSIDTLKLTFFYFPFLYFCLLVFVPYIFIRKYFKSRFIGVLTGILMFGSDLSFIPGLLGIVPQDYPWTLIFNTTTIWGLFTLNGYLPALFVMFLSVFYLKKFYEDGRLRYLLVFALLGFSAYGFKSSMGPHIMGAAFLTGIASVVFMKDRKKGMLLCVVSALTALAIVINITLFRGGTGNDIISFDLFNSFYRSLKNLGISEMSWVFYPMIFLVYILATFGIRALGFYSLKDVIGRKSFDPIIVFLTIFAISGFLLAQVLYIGLPSGDINNAGWFSSQSLMGAWLLLSYFLLRLLHYKKGFLGVMVLVILLSAPTTVQFLTLRFDNNYYNVEPDAIEVVNYLETTPPESVILHFPNYMGPSLASNLAGRSSVINIFRSFTTYGIGMTEERNRLRYVELFFNPSNVINRSFILKQYKVDYVYAPLPYATILDNEPMLIQVLKNKAYVLYKVSR